MKISTEKSGSIVYLNGEFLPEDKAQISIFDHLVLYGDGVYDTCCAWGGKVFRLEDHIDRLFESAEAAEIKIPLPRRELVQAVLKTVRYNKLKQAYIKIIVSRGVGDAPILQPINCKPSLLIFAKQYIQALAGEMNEVERVKIVSLRRIPSQSLDSKIKSCSYLNHVLAFLEAKRAGFDNAIELDLDGYVCEAPGYNIFTVKNGKLYTPSQNILMGITRRTVMELADQSDITVTETNLTTFDLHSAKEVFFSSTAGGIIPIIEVDGRPVADGKPGSVTKMIGKQYQKLLESGEQSINAYSE